MAEKEEKRIWWKFKRPKPNLKIEELEAKLREVERQRQAKERKPEGGSEG